MRGDGASLLGVMGELTLSFYTIEQVIEICPFHGSTSVIVSPPIAGLVLRQ